MATGHSNLAVTDEVIAPDAETIEVYKTVAQLDKHINQTKKAMEKAAKNLDFMEAEQLRDKLFVLQKEKEAMK